MINGDVKDLTSGSISKHLRILALPAALGMLFHTLYNITDVYLLAAYLSAKGEQNIEKAWDLNINGLLHILNFAVGITNTVRAEVMNMLPAIQNSTLSAVAEAKQRGGKFSKAFGD